MTSPLRKWTLLTLFAIVGLFPQPGSGREILLFPKVREFEVRQGARAVLFANTLPIAQASGAAYLAVMNPNATTGLALIYQVIKGGLVSGPFSAGLLYLKESAAQRKTFETLLGHSSQPRVYQISSQLPSGGHFPIARKSLNLTWIESEAGLDPSTIAEVESEWGKALRITDPSQTKIRIRLQINGTSSIEVWETDLEAVMNREPIPESVRQQWREEYVQEKKKFLKNRRDRWLQIANKENLEKIANPKSAVELPLEIITEQGEIIPVGPIASKGDAVKLLKIPF